MHIKYSQSKLVTIKKRKIKKKTLIKDKKLKGSADTRVALESKVV